MPLRFFHQFIFISLLPCLSHSVAAETTPNYGHSISYERSQYEEEYLIEDLTLTFKPVANSVNYEFSIWPNWTFGIGHYQSQGEIDDTLPADADSLLARNATVEAEHEIKNHNLYVYRYFDSWWSSLSYIRGEDDQVITFRSPNKVFRLEDDTEYQTYSLGIGRTFYMGQWVLGAHGYLDYQNTHSDYRYVLGQGTVSNRLVTSTNTDEHSVGYIGTVGANAGYDFTINSLMLSPNLAWSHTRTLDGEVNQFQQSQNRLVTTDRTTSIGEESESIRNSAANPISIWTASTSILWGNGWLRISRQHTSGAPFNEDVYGMALGWRFDH